MTQAEMIDYMEQSNRANARTIRRLKKECQAKPKAKRKLNIGRCVFAVYLVTMFGLLLTNLISKFMYLMSV